jgi:predicted acetyltransferase
LVTCDIDNVGSRKIIERNGGVLEAEVKLEEQTTPICRYWITLD